MDFQSILLVVLHLISVFAIAGTFLPYIPSDHWIVRGQTNFKFTYLIVCSTLLLIYLFVGTVTVPSMVLSSLLVAAIIDSLLHVLPYTKYYPMEMATAIGSTPDLSILIYNVYQYNRSYNELLQKVKSLNPDTILLLETDTGWAKHVEILRDDYPYVISEIRNDTYGILFFSRHEIIEGGIDHLVLPNVPSVEALLRVNDCMVRILGLHPKPPVPGEKLYSTSKDKEIMTAARHLKQYGTEHQILIGDLNDVAWSRVTTAFKKETGMIDPRIGRGTYSTFPTGSWLRFPLDHIFCSPRLLLNELRRLPDLGSDHYPMFVSLSLPPKKHHHINRNTPHIVP